MIVLRVMGAADVATIQNWPAYPPEFVDLDYALRSNGWLDEHRHKPDTWLYVAEQTGEIIAFTILSKTSATEAEFRIALRADKIGQGLGSTLTTMTLDKGFAEIKLARIHLIVRTNNPRAIRLYKSLGFAENGDCLKKVNGKQANFLAMILSKETYTTISG